MANLHPKVEEAFQEIDAAFFSGDTFQNAAALKRAQYFIDRWNREAERIRSVAAIDAQQDQHDSMHRCAECGSFDCNGECMEIP